MPRERKSKKAANALNDDGSEPAPKTTKKRRGSAATNRAAAAAAAVAAAANANVGSMPHHMQNGSMDPSMIGMHGPPPGMYHHVGGVGHHHGVHNMPPQPHGGYGDTLYASNPFDDTPPMMPHLPPPGMGPPPQNMGPGGGNGPMPPHGMMMMGNGMMSPHGGPPPPPGMMGPDGPMMGSQRMGPHGPPPPRMGGPMGPGGGGPPPPMMPGRIYPPEQSMVFNPNNPNAPPIYPCGICHKEVTESDQGILCESGCNFWFHRACTGLGERAFILLKNEIYAEWVCDVCLRSKQIPLIKLKP